MTNDSLDAADLAALTLAVKGNIERFGGEREDVLSEEQLEHVFDALRLLGIAAKSLDRVRALDDAWEAPE